MTQVKVVILNWNGASHLREFLPSVIATTPKKYEIIVVDNGSSDESLSVLENEFEGITIMRFSENYGYAGGYNKALMGLEGDYFLLLNSDVEPAVGYLDTLVDFITRDEKIAALAPKILSYRDKTKFEYAGASGGFIDSLGYPFCRGRIFKTLESDHGQYDTSREVFWASGACMLVRADFFKCSGGFDDKFFAHMEEIDLCWRAQKMGYKVMVCPQSLVYHLGGGSLSEDSPFKLKLNFRNNLAMMYKNLPRSKRAMVIFVRMILDGVSAMIYLMQGKKQYYKSVVTAHREFKKMKPYLRLKRIEEKNKPTAIYHGSIILRYFLGFKRFPKSL
ncbi:MAG: glycosyltransferase family 2 protein [Rikenellaceae bacterium]